MSKTASLDIRGTVPGITFAVHNAQLERVEDGVVPASLVLEPGLYMVREAPQSPPVVFELEEGRHYGLDLGPSGRGFYEDTRSRTARAVDRVVYKQKAQRVTAPSPTSVQPCPETFLRFRRLKGWTESEPVEPKLTHRLDGDVLWIDLEMSVKAIVFAQVLVTGHRPVNTALPGSGKSRLKLTIGRGRPRTEAHLADPTTNTAAQYLRQGNFEEAKRTLRTLEPPPDRPILDRWLSPFVSRFKDPVASALNRYALLRTGEAHWLKELPNVFLNNFDWLADGRVITTEIAARGGLHEAALSSVVGLPAGHLPLFSDGFSMMLSRLIEFTRDTELPASPSKEEPDPDGKKAEAMREHAERIAKARALLITLQRWAPHLDLSALTLTFRGAHIERPEDQTQVGVDETWTKLDLPTAASV